MARDILSYCAGMFDADGCFTMYKSHHKGSAGYDYIIPTARIEIRDEVIVDIFKELFGGNTRKQTRVNKNHSDTFVWKVTGERLEVFIRKILPYLILKTEQAELILKFRSIRSGKSTSKITEVEYAQMEACLTIMGELNKTGVGKHRKLLPGENHTGDE